MTALSGMQTLPPSGDTPRKRYILETIGNGVVLADFDNDGLVDLFAPMAPGLASTAGPVGTRLYRNRGGLRFEDVTQQSGLAVAPGYEGIDVRWPGGTSERFPGGAANRIVVLKRGEGRTPPGQHAHRH